MLMHEISEFFSRKRPDAEALVDEGTARQSWRTLEERAERIAAMLAAHNIEKGDRVCFLGRNCIEIFHLFFACSKIGALYVPVNYRFALPEIVRLLEDSQPKIFLAHSEYREVMRQLMETASVGSIGLWLVVDAPSHDDLSLESQLQGAPARSYFPAIRDDDPSWVCYTGGTTGRSKGVLLSHKNMIAAALNFIVTCEINSSDVYLVAGALFHIALVVPIAYWLAGAKVVLTNFEPSKALDLISAEGVTQMVSTGTIFKMLTEAMEHSPRPTRLRLMFCGGAPVSPQLVRRAADTFRCQISQIYGQTECTLMATYLYPGDYERGFAAAPGSPEAKRLHSVGQAAPMCLIRIVDADLQDVAGGEVGEIAIRGDPVMVGYANMREQTAETLQGGWLRTGDLGYMDGDGYVYLVDRIKDVIITGGENVYSGEVELVLLEHPIVSEAVVLGIPHEHWGEQVIALIVLKEGAKPDEDDLRAFCRKRLAVYKVPKRIEFRTSLPRLPTGKIAKGKLREEFWTGQARRIHGI